jgi:hypothetical protein
MDRGRAEEPGRRCNGFGSLVSCPRRFAA